MKPFSNIASTYDHDFSNSMIGKAQREIVWEFLHKNVVSPKNILEINCGTGEDAIYLAKNGHAVFATDGSNAMIEITNKKIIENQLREKIRTGIWDLNQPFPFGGEKFDLVFSDFGGLNCLPSESISNLFRQLHGLLNENGEIIFVVMGKFCLMETIYFLLKGKWRTAFRRSSGKTVEAKLGDNSKIDIEYYSSSDLIKLAGNLFEYREKKTVGVCLPPSYTEAYFNRHPRWFSFLKKADKTLENYAWLSGMSDHYILRLRKLSA